MRTAELDRTVGSRITEAMDRIENPEPTAVAEVVLRQLDPDDLTPPEIRYYAVRGLAEKVRDAMSRRRRGGGPTSSARWSETARQQASGELELARIAVYTGIEHKWLTDCSAEDLDGAVVEHERQAEALRAGAEKLTALAGMVRRKRGATTVADLPADKVRSVLNA